MNTLLDSWDRRALTTSFAANNFVRGSAWRHGGRRGHREWLHFTVHAEALRVVINASFVDDLRPAAERHRERVRVLVLAHDGSCWHGGIDEIEDAIITAGQLTATLGDLVLASADDTITLRGALRGLPLALDLTFTPQTFPSLASGVALGDGPPINWLVVPKLTASGTITIAGRTHALAGAHAYHDHNWGYFSHQDVAWQWGHDASAGPDSVVLARLLDSAHATTFMQALLVWRGARQARLFRGDDLVVEPEGFLRPPRPFTLPPAASLLVGATATEVPRRLHIRARADGDDLTATFEAETVARIVVPSDDGLHTTIIHEVGGRLHVQGSLHDRPFELDAPAMFEMLRSIA